MRRIRTSLPWAAAIAAAFVACWLLFPAEKAACGCVFMSGLIGAAGVDLELMIIPDIFTVGLAAAGVVLSFFVPELHHFSPAAPLAGLRSAAAALLGLGIASSVALWIGIAGETALGKEVLGFGDVKFVGAIGAFCGWQGGVFSIFAGALLGAVMLAAAAAHRRIAGREAVSLFRMETPGAEPGHLGLNTQFPFGPMLSAAAALYFLALHPWADRVLSQYLALF